MATRVNVTRPVDYVPGVYKSEYTDRLNKALDTVTNWNYDPLKDASYLALANVYAARGNIAAKNSMADAAALNGGYGTSHAVSAAQQARNQYNQQLAELIPGLESAAYEKASGTLSALRSADDTAYGRFRDTETDKQWKYSQDMSEYQWGTDYNYQLDRDAIADSQWQKNFDYQASRDAIADQQWAQEYALKAAQQAQSSSGGSSGGGGGGGSKKSGKSSSSSSKSSSSSSKKTTTTKVNPNIQAAQTKGKSTTAYYQKQTKSSSSSKKKSGGGGR